MDETLRFFIGITLFLAVVTYEWIERQTIKRTS